MSEPVVETPHRRIPRGVLPITGILALVALLVFVFQGRFGQDPRSDLAVVSLTLFRGKFHSGFSKQDAGPNTRSKVRLN